MDLLSATDTPSLRSGINAAFIIITQFSAWRSGQPFAVKNRGAAVQGTYVFPVRYAPRVKAVPDIVAREKPPSAQGGAGGLLNYLKCRRVR